VIAVRTFVEEHGAFPSLALALIRSLRHVLESDRANQSGPMNYQHLFQ
jgi:hypothetical protein